MKSFVYIISFLSIALIVNSFSLFGNNNPGKPNFILIVADDLGYGDLGFQGSKQIPTPNIDKLAKEGIIFSNAYVSSSVCSPSRAGLLTGKNQSNFGFTDNLFPAQSGFDPEYVGLPVAEKTLADKLKSLGYVNGIIGKWHLGEKKQFHPLQRGFAEFWGFLGGAHDYYIAKPQEIGSKSSIECNYASPNPITYITDDIGNESVDFIHRHKREAFFLFASFSAPHSPMQALMEDLKLFSHVQDELRRTYCAMVYRLDKNVGRILDAVRKEGLENNTFIVFISDNGGPANVNSNGSVNAPLRGQKTTLLEGGIRVPYVMKWPSTIVGGKKNNTMVSSLDITPTFVAAAGGMISEKDKYSGVNLIPFLTNESDKLPHTTLEWRYTISAAIRDGDWKLIRLPDRLPQLYNLSLDVKEENNVALQHLELTESLLKKLGTWELYLPHAVFHEPVEWRIRHLGFYDVKYQLSQPE